MSEESEAILVLAHAITRLAIAVEGRPQQQQQGFVAQSEPPQPEGACPEHGTPWRLVPAGISKKSGKRYNAFWTCSTQGCDIKPGQVVEQLPW